MQVDLVPVDAIGVFFVEANVGSADRAWRDNGEGETKARWAQ